MKQENIALLLGYFASQRKIIDMIREDIKTFSPDNAEKVSHLGYLLHNLYSALEDLFQKIAKTFENQIDDKAKYHWELLKRMKLDIPGIRPRLLSKESGSLLNDLRGFRHIFRHAYDYELNPDRLTGLKKRLTTGWPTIQNDLDDFCEFLRDNIE